MFFDERKLLLIAGPCVIENESMVCTVAEFLDQLREKFSDLQIVFKSSFDKANRSSIKSFRGVGIDEGLRLFSLVKSRYGLPVLSDIHWPEQAHIVAQVCDVLQIPAFLCRQTDLLVAAAKTGKVVSVKKGQFLSPYEMRHVVEKLRESGASEIWQCERGATFGYNNLVVDMRSFEIMKENGTPVIFDATHSVQLPGAATSGTGGDRRFVPLLARAALAAGVDGMFFEIHPSPDNAYSDAATQIALSDFEKIINDCLKIWNVSRSLH